MATPHHHTFPTEEQRRRRPQRSLLHRTRLQRPRLPLLSQPAHHSLRRAVWRNPKSVPTASVVVAASESGQHGSTAHSTARSSSVTACSPSSPPPLPARPPSCTAHPAAHTSSRDTSPPTGVAAGLPAAHAHDFGCSRPRWRGPSMRIRTARMPGSCTAVESHCSAAHTLGASAPTPPALTHECDAVPHTALLQVRRAVAFVEREVGTRSGCAFGPRAWDR